MTPEEQISICEAIAVTCMWGHSGVGANILERLDKSIPTNPTWRHVHDAHCKDAKRRHMGVLDDEARLDWHLKEGYWLTNWDEDGCALFNPPPMNGLCMYVSKRLADQYVALRGY